MAYYLSSFGFTTLLLVAQWDLSEASDDRNGSSAGIHCQDGLVIPVWMPIENLTSGDRLARGIVYFFGLLYLFIGVSIISDRFMAAIEVITSQEKEVKVRRPNGETQIVVVRVWNETVANLTLMALGSSAPEILLSIIEIIAKNFNAGDLGPGTIVGSAAYNLFVIIAICVLVIPNGEVRKIKHLRVFFVTAAWSIFAYVWLYLILAVISPGVVEVWEGFLTFMFFPTTVLTAYIADRRLLIYKYLNKDYRMNKRGVIVQAEGASGTDLELANKEEPYYDNVVDEIEEARREYIETLRELRKKNPQCDLREIEVMAHEAILNKTSKSRAFYRVQATRKMMGSGNVMKKISERAQSDLSEVRAELQRGPITVKAELEACAVCFDPGSYTVMENCGEFEVTVVRKGDPDIEFTVNYCTEDGSAEAGSDYYEASGVLEFAPGDMKKTFSVRVIDDDVFEQDEHFYIRLSDPQEPVTLATPRVATVVILDDDHSGIFSFAEKDHDLVESVGTYELKVVRQSGARGRVIVPYWTEGGTAKEGKDYEAAKGELIFENNETE